VIVSIWILKIKNAAQSNGLPPDGASSPAQLPVLLARRQPFVGGWPVKQFLDQSALFSARIEGLSIQFSLRVTASGKAG
tara:strand:- start:5713 stop:5949 length:237 start_codon:yes stop_codon:yes gene_type:complete